MIKAPKIIQLLLPLLKLQPWVIPAIILLGLLSSAVEGIGISLFIPLLHSLVPGSQSSYSFIIEAGSLTNLLNRIFVHIPAEQQFATATIFIFLSILIKIVLSYGNTVVFAWYSSHVGHRLRSAVFHQLMTVSYRFWENSESGQLMNTLATETWQTVRALGVLVHLIITICTIAIFAGLLLLLSWRLTLVVGVAIFLISMLIQFLTRRVKQLGQQAVQVNQDLANRMWESFGGLRLIREFGREAYEQSRYDQASMAVRDTFLKLELLSGTVGPLSEALSATLLLFVLAIVVQQNQTALPTLLTFILILYRLQPKVKQLDGARVGLLGLTSSVEAVMLMLDSSNKPYIRSGTKAFVELNQAIDLKSVSFGYDSEQDTDHGFDHDLGYDSGKSSATNSAFALQNVSLQIPRGKMTALVGPSGAGKSTLISLLCRFYDPTEGEIEIDGCPLREFDLHSWRERIAIVSQDIYLFNTTVRENIAYGRLEATDDEIIEAATLANAHEFICQLPHGYETKVGDLGGRLSGGQCQRLALARAIVRNPEILILDEATNSLDSIAENLIQEALNTLSQNRTVIVIAHRLSTIEQADQIIVLNKGQVVEQGKLQQLLKLNGLFAKLYYLQFRNAQSLETTL